MTAKTLGRGKKMVCLSVDDLKNGMVLSEDVLDINARLLISKGQKITPKQIRVLKIWGITEVDVVGEKDQTNTETPQADPEIIQEVKESTKEIFKNVDLKHPAIKEIFELSVDHRCQNHKQPPIDNIKFQINENIEDKKRLNLREKIETL
jgi:hypothetical protein